MSEQTSITSMEDIISLCKRRGFIFQGSEIYGGLAGTWDYGPLGVQLKRNITDLWWKMFVTDRDDIYGLDAATLMNKRVWQASGHEGGFSDPMIECSNCKSRFRADHLVDTNKCPTCGKTGTLSEPRQFNMMFKTNVGPVHDEQSVSYFRPETAQGIFVNFRNIVDSFYPDIPFGIAQIGKAFRNEISPREFLFRTREFEQMEIEYFVHPDKWEEEFEKWRRALHAWLNAVGIPNENVHELEVHVADRAHYSKRTTDFEFDYPFGRKELLGLAYRSNYDLTQHQGVSGKNMEYTPKEGGEPFIPHVIEPSLGVDRLFLALLVSAYSEDEINSEKRVVLKLPEHMAPVKLAVFPLLKNKPELVEKAREVYKTLKEKYGEVMWDDGGNIGKRYRRQDEIGTPRTVTVDFQTLDDNTVTIRDRDTTNQERIQISEV